uniref:Flagellar assembly protein FliH n=1 Tax=Caldimicrobium thiodismutans TaxID=1653476 RepID=A0A832GP92_9BACT
MSKIIKSSKLSHYKYFEPRLVPREDSSFSALLISQEEEEEEEVLQRSSKRDPEAELEEQLRLGYEEGFKRGYEEGLLLGRKEGFEEGFKEGVEEGKREAEKRSEEERLLWQKKFEEEKRGELAKIHDFLLRAEEELKKVILNMDQEIVKIVTKVVEKMLLREVSQDQELLLRLIREALNYIAEGTEINIRVNPKEIEVLESYREIFPSTYRVRLLPDETISPGGLFIETKLGVIDATFEKRWERMLSLLEGKELL